jgi:signal transduction histidine kinase/ligand-binding sensor domain-containing protein
LKSLNIFHRARPSPCLGCALFALFVASGAPLLGASKVGEKPLSQYLREEWGSDKGFIGGPANAIAQTPDGYLWIGTQQGLVRFDGKSFQLFTATEKNANPMGAVLGLLTDGDGNLWIRLQGAGILRYRDGKFEDLTGVFAVPEMAVTRMCLADDGRPVFATLINGIVIFDHGKFVRLAAAPQLPDFLVISMARAPNGDYWLGTRDTGMYLAAHGVSTPSQQIHLDRQINALLSVGTKDLWIGTDHGLLFWDGSKLAEVGANTPFRDRQFLALIQDSHGSIWAGTDRGTYRLDPQSNFLPTSENFEPGGPVYAIFQGREGNIWTAKPRGLLRLRNTIFTSYSTPEGLPEESSGPLFVEPDGRLWFAPSSGGLYSMKDRRVERLDIPGLAKDVVYSIAGRGGDIWAGRQLGGLTRLHKVGEKWDALTYTKADGLAQDSVYSLRIDREGALWAGSLSAGVTRIQNGKFSRFTTENGLLSNTISSIAEGLDGTLWFATPRGLNSLSKGHWSSYSQYDGLPSDDITCLLQDSDGTLWIGTASGLASIHSGKIWLPQPAPEVLREPIYGLRVDSSGMLWISTSNHVAMLPRERLFQSDFSPEDIREFGFADGLRDTDGVKRDGSVVSDSSGQIWFSLKHSLAVVDANRARTSAPPVILHMESLSADGSPLPLQNPILVPPDTHRVRIECVGVSLSVPDRVRFKYKLDGSDPAWSEPVASPEATYNNLAAGSYLFHLIASNSDGVWNSAELSVPFTVQPVFWRTWWFGLITVIALLLLLLAFIRLRVLALTRQMHVRFEERLAERARIARELHDTLLQGFTGLLLRFHSVAKRIPENDPARKTMNEILDRGDQILIEGRETIKGLRVETVNLDDLQRAFAAAAEELKADAPLECLVATVGAPRPLHPVIRSEVFRIGREALTNAFQHSHGSLVEAELAYEPYRLVLRIRDNGRGIDPGVLQAGSKQGHWGLLGMRERAEKAGGRLRIWSKEAAGTEIELVIPGKIAFQSNSNSSPWRTILNAFKPHAAHSHKSEEQ